MNIKNSIAKWVLGGYSLIGRDNGKSYMPDFYESNEDFAGLMFLNIIELLTDITNDVTLTLKKGDPLRFAEFKVFFDNYGQETLNMLFNKGYAVVCYGGIGFTLLYSDDYTTNSNNQVQITNQKYLNYEKYVLKSDSYRMSGKSDRQLLRGFLKYLDNTLNASNTTTARLGSLIMASPQQAGNSPVMASVTDAEKEQAEKEISEDYGGLKKQKQILIWRQAMNFTTINLSGLDKQTIEKAKFAINAICDRLKIPANQVSIVESQSSNGLSNGGELREGDLLKYKTYERLLNKTFIKMAADLDMIVEYSIYNKPVAAVPQQPTV